MNGIELAEAFYRQYGEPALRDKFPDLMDKIAVGVAGSGSDSFGFDDEISRDHDYWPGFCIFIPDENVVSRREEFLLERAYSALPKEFMGVKMPAISPVGGNRRGVMRIADFFMRTTGTPDGELSLQSWLTIPENYLFEATNGKIFYDGYGLVTSIREKLSNIPPDVRLKKIAGSLIVMNQSGQYNYPRCVARGENGAAQLALYEFVNAAIHIAFLLSRKYMPYYKWRFYALRQTGFSSLATALEFLVSSDNRAENFAVKSEKIACVCETLARAVMADTGAEGDSVNLEKLAYSVNDKIKSGNIRNANIFAAV